MLLVSSGRGHEFTAQFRPNHGVAHQITLTSVRVTTEICMRMIVRATRVFLQTEGPTCRADPGARSEFPDSPFLPFL